MSYDVQLGYGHHFETLRRRDGAMSSKPCFESLSFKGEKGELLRNSVLEAKRKWGHSGIKESTGSHLDIRMNATAAFWMITWPICLPRGLSSAAFVTKSLLSSCSYFDYGDVYHSSRAPFPLEALPLWTKDSSALELLACYDNLHCTANTTTTTTIIIIIIIIIIVIIIYL